MTEPTSPLKLVPRHLPKPWGGRRIAELYGRSVPPETRIGESWELFDRPDGASGIASGPLTGRTVADLRGNRALPLLTKVIDAHETLSVQVHPDAEAADELDGEAKTEAWYVIEAAPGARIYKGLRDGVKAPELAKAVREGRVEECLHSFAPNPGDVVFLPPGTVHAIGAGVVLYEVQQNSDTTYRLFDWNRPGLDGQPRDLHLQEAIQSTDFSGRGLDRVEPRPIIDDGIYRRTLRVSCRHFALEEQEMMGLTTFETERRGKDTWHAVFVLSGEGTIRAFRRGAEDVFFTAGDSILLPAEHDCYEIEPRAGRTIRLLTAYVP